MSRSALLHSCMPSVDMQHCRSCPLFSQLYWITGLEHPSKVWKLLSNCPMLRQYSMYHFLGVLGRPKRDLVLTLLWIAVINKVCVRIDFSIPVYLHEAKLCLWSEVSPHFQGQAAWPFLNLLRAIFGGKMHRLSKFASPRSPQHALQCRATSDEGGIQLLDHLYSVAGRTDYQMLLWPKWSFLWATWLL